MKTSRRPVWVLACVASFSFIVGAQAQQVVQRPSIAVGAGTSVPRLIRFTGVLRDHLGNPLTGTLGVTFALYKDPEGGAPLWLETQNVEADGQGRYSVLLGATSSEGLPLELFTAGEARWLGVSAASGQRTEEQARVLLVSVPYALLAANAETLGGKPASAFLTTEPAAAGTGGSSGKSAPAGTSLASVPLASGMGTMNFVAKWTDNAGTLGNASLFDDGTRVSVSEPVQALSYQFSGNAAPPTDATATILNQAFVGPVFSGLSFKVRTGVTPADALSIDSSQNVSMTGNVSGLAYKFTGNAAPPTDATATILNQAFVGPVFSGLSFKVRTGSGTPADALSIDASQNVSVVAGNLVLSGAGKAIVFPNGSMQTSAAITAVNTPAGSGLMGGASSGAVNLSLLNTCAGGQVLQWTGTMWACFAAGVASVGQGTGIIATPNPITTTGTVSFDTTFGDARYAQLATSPLVATLATGTSIASGTCISQKIAAPGVTTSMAVIISPAGDPSANGLPELIWGAFVDSAGSVTAQFCHFSRTTDLATANQNFNLRVIK